MQKGETKFDILKKSFLYDNVLVRAVQNVSAEDDMGIVNPEGYEEKPCIGEVLAVGHGRLLDSGEIAPLIVKVGDIVLFNEYSSTRYHINSEDYYVIREEDIACH